MSNALLTIGALLGSFLFVAIFAFIIQRIARSKQRERLIQGIAFAYIKREMSRFQGEIKRLVITGKRPTVDQMFDLQDYFASKECGSGWESEAIKYTFKNMQMLGYEVKLYRKGKRDKDPMIEVDLSTLFVAPSKEVKKEIKQAKKERRRQNGRDSSEESEGGGEAGGPKKHMDDEEGTPNPNP